VKLLYALCLLLCAFAAPAEPQNRQLQTDFEFFSDNRQVDVLEIVLSYYESLKAQTGIGISYKVDSISSASISCSTCHRGTQGIQRHQISLETKHRTGPIEFSAGLYTSREKDYASDALTLSTKRQFNRDHTTLQASYSFSWDRSRPHGRHSLRYAGGSRGYWES
jgi:hypothetical protein